VFEQLIELNKREAEYYWYLFPDLELSGKVVWWCTTDNMRKPYKSERAEDAVQQAYNAVIMGLGK